MKARNAKLGFFHLGVLGIVVILFSHGTLKASAQASGSCCAQFETENKKCGEAGCSGEITIHACIEPYGANSIEYHVKEVRCCSLSFSTFNAPTGTLNCSGGPNLKASAPDMRPLPIAELASLPAVAEAPHNEGVWVRLCPQKYAFIHAREQSYRPGI